MLSSQRLTGLPTRRATPVGSQSNMRRDQRPSSRLATCKTYMNSKATDSALIEHCEGQQGKRTQGARRAGQPTSGVEGSVRGSAEAAQRRRARGGAELPRACGGAGPGRAPVRLQKLAGVAWSLQGAAASARAQQRHSRGGGRAHRASRPLRQQPAASGSVRGGTVSVRAHNAHGAKRGAAHVRPRACLPRLGILETCARGQAACSCTCLRRSPSPTTAACRA